MTLAGAVAGALKESPTLNLTNAEVGLASSFYLAGAVLGALLFGWLTDRLGRKRLFFITLTVRFGVAAERKPLEAVATPLSAADCEPTPLVALLRMGMSASGTKRTIAIAETHVSF